MIRGSVVPQTAHLLAPNGKKQSSEQWLPWRYGSMEEFKQAHAQMIKVGVDGDPRRTSELIASCALSEWGSVNYAASIFRRSTTPTTYDVNTLLRGHVLEGNPDSAVLFYKEMTEEEDDGDGWFRPDNFTFTFLLKACARIPSPEVGQQLHGQAYKHGCDLDVFVQNSLISFYGRCGEPELAEKIFERMPARTAASWSSLMAGFARAQRWEDSVSLFRRMISSGHRPDESSLGCVVVSAGDLGFLAAGRCAHGHSLRISGDRGNIALQTSLVDMYMRCGCPESALKVFGEMPERNLRTYTAAISGLAAHGGGKAALELFDRMLARGLHPDGAAYAAALTACARNGLVAEGRRRFAAMTAEHGVEKTKQHYACMVDLLARAGMVEEAHQFAVNMPEKPHDAVWRSLLSACRDQKNLEIGEAAAKKLTEMGTGNAGDYILLADLYGRSGKWEEAAAARKKMADAGAAQRVGASTVETAGGRRHRFVSEDRSHPSTSRIYATMQQVEWQLRYRGGCEEEEGGGGASLKVAICFGLSEGGEGGSIRIVMNVRMCRGCHEYGKLVSKAFGREIVVREPGRFHRFKDGSCSCGDFW